MKVLHIGLGAMHGGMESFMAGLIRRQRQAGIESDVIFGRDMGAADQFEGLCRVMFHDKVYLEEVLLRERYDVLHIGTSEPHWAANRIRRARYTGGVVLTSHHCGARESIFRSDCVVAVSNAVADSIRDTYGDKLRVIYNGIDPAVFYPPDKTVDGKRMVAWVGRSSDAVKNVGALVAAASSPVLSEFQITIVDASADPQHLAGWLPEGCVVHERKPLAEMPDFYRSVAASRGFLLSTSRLEGCPMNMIEAHACGCPVIAPAVGGIPEVVEHEVTGYLFRPEDGLAGLADAVRRLYIGDNYRAASEAAVKRVRASFTLDRMCSEYTRVYEDAIAKHHGEYGAKLFQVAFRAALPALKLARRNRGRK